MLQTTQVMSKASRQVITELNKYADNAGVQGFLIPAHIYMCDYMVCKYHAAGVINVIRSQMSKIAPNKREYKHFTPIYWYKLVDNMLGGSKQAKGVQRVMANEIHGEMIDYNAFNHITKMFLASDYSVQDAEIINMIVNKYTLQEVINACKTASNNGVYSMAYVSAVLNDIDGKRKAEQLRAKLLGEKIEKSTESIQTTVHTHTPIELAQSEYNYNKKREDVLLELLLNKMLNGEGK